MSDPRIPLLVEALLNHHVPGKKVSEMSEEILDVAIQEAELLLKVLDGLRPPDIGVLSPRQVEHVAAYSQIRQLQDNIEFLKEELEDLSTSPKFEHIEAGLAWAIETLSNRTFGLDAQ